MKFTNYKADYNNKKGKKKKNNTNRTSLVKLKGISIYQGS